MTGEIFIIELCIGLYLMLTYRYFKEDLDKKRPDPPPSIIDIKTLMITGLVLTVTGLLIILGTYLKYGTGSNLGRDEGSLIESIKRLYFTGVGIALPGIINLLYLFKLKILDK